MEIQQFYYDNKIVKKFIYATIVFGVVGMLVGFWCCGNVGRAYSGHYVSVPKYDRRNFVVEFW